ncbi:MAG: hypothetical protein QOI86_1223, partial [Actinomycetota bacterium]|nr:hypothetical protein [Actinomycetota bacterium]
MTVDVAEFHVTRDSAGLVVDGLRVQFGGLVAV